MAEGRRSGKRVRRESIVQLCMQMAPTGHTQEPRLSGPLARAVRLHRRGRRKRGEEEAEETKCIYMQNTNKTL